jgi:hypothetical protein
MLETTELRDSIPQEKWTLLEKSHIQRIKPWTTEFRDRRRRNIKHPVFDFLFSYYSFPLSYLERWNPGHLILLEGEDAQRIFPEKSSSFRGNGYFLDPSQLTSQEIKRMQWICKLLESVVTRPPVFHCYGLHEWAMVYKSDQIRHDQTPLRMGTKELEAFVESQKICCTHYDAYRFFTAKATPLNTMNPERENRSSMEQSACVHFTMDLYKWCYKLHPWIPSEITYNAFQLALKAREIDMRASPYDIQSYGFPPIKIETAEGRAEYIEAQKNLLSQATPIRESIIQICKTLLPTENPVNTNSV